MFGIWNQMFISNTSSIQHRIDAITAAMKAAEELKLQSLPESEIIEKIDAMEKTFPPLTNEFETTTVRAPDVSQVQRAIW
jgi:hypothetical protein